MGLVSLDSGLSVLRIQQEMGPDDDQEKGESIVLKHQQRQQLQQRQQHQQPSGGGGGRQADAILKTIVDMDGCMYDK